MVRTVVPSLKVAQCLPLASPGKLTASAVNDFCAQFDHLFNRHAARTTFRQYLIGLLLPQELNKALTVLASLVPGSKRQSLHHFLHDAPWEVEALNRQRLALWQTHATLAPHADGVLLLDETRDCKRGHGSERASNQYLGKLGLTTNGVVWSDQPAGRWHAVDAAEGAALLAGQSVAFGQKGPALPHQAGTGLKVDRGSPGGQDPLLPDGGGLRLRREGCAPHLCS